MNTYDLDWKKDLDSHLVTIQQILLTKALNLLILSYVQQLNRHEQRFQCNVHSYLVNPKFGKKIAVPVGSQRLLIIFNKLS